MKLYRATTETVIPAGTMCKMHGRLLSQNRDKVEMIGERGLCRVTADIAMPAEPDIIPEPDPDAGDRPPRPFSRIWLDTVPPAMAGALKLVRRHVKHDNDEEGGAHIRRKHYENRRDLTRPVED